MPHLAFPVDFWLLQFVFYRFHGLIQLIVGFRIILIRLILNLYIGGDSFSVNASPFRRKVFCNGQLHAGIILQVKDLLYHALSVCLGSHNIADSVVLNGPCIDFGSAGAITIYQYCQRQRELVLII